MFMFLFLFFGGWRKKSRCDRLSTEVYVSGCAQGATLRTYLYSYARLVITRTQGLPLLKAVAKAAHWDSVMPVSRAAATMR